jgi:PDZ domain-containing protein
MSKWKPKPGAKPLIAKKWAPKGSSPDAPPRNQEAPARPALTASNSGRAPCVGCKGIQLRVAVGQKEALRPALVSAIEKVAGFILSFFDAVVLEAEPIAAPSASSADRWEGLGFGVVAANDGIVVSHVSGDSPGAAAGLAPGDLIFQVEDEHPKDIASFAYAIRKGEKWAVHRLMFSRDGQPHAVAIANPKA